MKMKKVFAPLLVLISLNSMAQFPYNPDSNNDSLITLTDLVAFLPYFGQVYYVDEVLAIENGGTGANNADEARLNLDLGLFSDSSTLVNNNPIPAGWVNGGLRVMGRFAHGDAVSATGLFSHASGSAVTASGDFSNAQNRNTIASGICAHAEGEGSAAANTAAHAEGFQTEALGVASHSEGWATEASGLYSHAQNRNTRATAICSHAEGEGCVASDDAAHAEGMNTVSSGVGSHSEGFGTDATGNYSHAEGRLTLASGQSSHASGESCTASATATYAGGNMAVASGAYGFAHGLGVLADHNEHFAVGRYNLGAQIDVIFAVGNGTGGASRSDAFQVNNNGSATLAGQLNVGGTVVASGTDLVLEITNLQSENAVMAAQIAELQAAILLLQQGIMGGNNE